MTDTAVPFILGSSDISSFLQRGNVIEADALSALDKQLELMGGLEGKAALPCEEEAHKALVLQRINHEYPLIDASFLSMSVTDGAEYHGRSFPAPRFAVFPVYEDNTFSISIDK